jgi:hypothetical protein
LLRNRLSSCAAKAAHPVFRNVAENNELRGLVNHPLEPAIGQRFALTRWQMMTTAQ